MEKVAFLLKYIFRIKRFRIIWIKDREEVGGEHNNGLLNTISFISSLNKIEGCKVVYLVVCYVSQPSWKIQKRSIRKLVKN